jgi:phosphoribosylglycinamide formyltransferase-1
MFTKPLLRIRKKETGITIHYVNEHYDEGGCISKKSNLSGSETPEDIAERIHELEQSFTYGNPGVVGIGIQNFISNSAYNKSI